MVEWLQRLGQREIVLEDRSLDLDVETLYSGGVRLMVVLLVWVGLNKVWTDITARWHATQGR